MPTAPNIPISMDADEEVNGADDANATRPPLANESAGLGDEILAVVLLSVLSPTFRIVIDSLATSRLSKKASPSHCPMTASDMSSMTRSFPQMKLSVTGLLVD